MMFAKAQENGSCSHGSHGNRDHEQDCLDPTDLEAPPLVEPQDGGWGWVIVFASFMCMVIVDGVCFSYSTFNLQIMKHFDVGLAQSTWVGSLLFGCYLIAGPFVSVLANKYGCRRIVIAGALISSAAFLLSVLSPNIEVLILTYGVLGGIGFGLIYLPAIVIVGYWFEKKRAFATGITVCGSGIGTFIFAPVSAHLLEEYDWRGGTVIMAGIILNCAVLGALFRPLEPPKIKRMKRGEVQRGSIMKALIEEKRRQRTISNGSLDNCIITKDNRLIKIDQISIKSSRNGFIPRLKETLGFSSRSLNKSKNSLVLPSIYIERLGDNGTIIHHHRPGGRGIPPRLTAIPPHMRPATLGRLQPQTNGDPMAKGDSHGHGQNGDCNVPKARSYDMIPRNDPWDRLSGEGSLSKKSLSCHSVQHAQLGPQFPVLTGSFVNIPISACGSVLYSSQTKILRSSRSLYGSRGNRHSVTAAGLEALVGGSVMSVPQYSASIQSLEYLYEEESSCCSTALNILRRIFDVTLLRSPMFALLCILSMLSMLGFFIPFMYIQPYAKMFVGVDDTDSAFLLSIIGIANTVGRVISGWVADRPWADSLLINNTALCIAGILTCLVPFCTSYAALAGVSVGFGICIAAFVSLRSILLVDLLGIEKLTNSFGLLILFQGTATIAGPPLAGVLESTVNMNSSFYMAGILIFLSGALGYPLRRIKLWEEGRMRAPSLPDDTPINENYQLDSLETTI